MLFDFQVHSHADVLDGNAGGVGAENRARPAHRGHFLQEVLLDLEIFDNDFDDPVDFRQAGEMVFKIAHLDQAGEFRDRQGCRAHF